LALEHKERRTFAENDPAGTSKGPAGPDAGDAKTIHADGIHQRVHLAAAHQHGGRMSGQQQIYCVAQCQQTAQRGGAKGKSGAAQAELPGQKICLKIWRRAGRIKRRLTRYRVFSVRVDPYVLVLRTAAIPHCDTGQRRCLVIERSLLQRLTSRPHRQLCATVQAGHLSRRK
jgi:hypothetical protein